MRNRNRVSIVPIRHKVAKTLGIDEVHGFWVETEHVACAIKAGIEITGSALKRYWLTK
jgi:hypothetical protein